MAQIGNYKRSKFITHTVLAAEYSSGVVNLPIITDIISSGTDLNYLWQVRTSANVNKYQLKTNYVKPSGVLQIVNSGESLATADVITVLCTFS